MRILLISDIHANLVALQQVLADAAPWDRIWCLGDIVGYGPHPNECVQKLIELEALCLAGNHDWAVLGKLDLDDFNPDARRAVEWTRREIGRANLDYLGGLQGRLTPAGEPYTLAHGSPRHPIWEYILTTPVAAANLDEFDTPFCFFGHTHIPVVFRAVGPHDVLPEEPVYGEPLALGSDRLLVNPGSVGQPRDGDSRAAYAILDTDPPMLTHHRVAYDIASTQADMVKAKLPPRLIARLNYGM